MSKQFLNLLFLTILFATSSIFIHTCSDLRESNEIQQRSLYSREEITGMKKWMSAQILTLLIKKEYESYVNLKYKPATPNSDATILKQYLNGINFLNDAILNDIEINYNYDFVFNKVMKDPKIDFNGKKSIASFLQISQEVITSREFKADYLAFKSSSKLRDPCGCASLYSAYLIAEI
jgi:hypothetical protein